jgi:uncharacterized SAM-binding protein YcdF (DUF218 family)
VISLLVPSSLHALLALAILTAMAYGGHRGGGRLHRSRHPLALLTAWVWLCCTPIVANHLMERLEGDPAPTALQAAAPRDPGTTVLVLGSGEMWTPNGRTAPRLDEHGWERLHGGVQLWRRTGGRLVFTGGPGGEDQATLAGRMSGIAAELGVPSEALAIAVKSRTTYEDLVAARPLVQPAGPVWLVTSAVHMPRALAVARRLGIKAQPYPVDHRQIRQLTWRAWLPDSGASDRMLTVLHEIVGRVYYRWQGWGD